MNIEKLKALEEYFGEAPKFVAVVEDFHYDTAAHDSRSCGYETIDEAFESARKAAEASGMSGVSYWVEADFEYKDCVVTDIGGYSGCT